MNFARASLEKFKIFGVVTSKVGVFNGRVSALKTPSQIMPSPLPVSASKVVVPRGEAKISSSIDDLPALKQGFSSSSHLSLPAFTPSANIAGVTSTNGESKEGKVATAKINEEGRALRIKSRLSLSRNLSFFSQSMGANFDASDSKLLPAPPELTASLSPWLSEMKNFLAPLQEHPAVATSLSLYGTYRARLAYLTPLLQRIQLMAANIHTKKNDLLLRLSQASEHAYTITDERINTQLIQVLKTEAEKLNQEVVEMQKGLPTPPIIFSGIAKQWKKEISLLSKVSPQLTSYFCMTDMILLCQCKRHGEAENAVLEALSEYLKANNPDSRDEVLSFCRNLFKVVKIFEKILEWQEKTDGADISEINQMIDSLEDSILGATEFDLVSHLYNPTQLQWYRDICIYLGYAFHDSLNSTSDKLKDMINKVPPSSWSQRFMQIIVRFHKLVNTDLRKIPALFTIIAAEARGDNDNDKLSNKYNAVLNF